MTKASPVKQNRFPAIDGLRGIAIIWVTALHIWAASHLHVANPNPLIVWISRGGTGVQLFFALSGFCLFYPIAKNPSLEVNWKRFYMRRWIRIYPAFLLAVLIWTPVWMLNHPHADWHFQLLTHLTFTYVLTAATFQSISVVLWSLGVEEHFYLFLPVLVLALKRRWWYLIAGLCLLSIVWKYLWRLYGLSPTPPYIAASLPANLLLFLSGIFTAMWYARRGAVSSRMSSWLWAYGGFVLLVAPALHRFSQTPGSSSWPGEIILSSTGWGALILASVSAPRSWPAGILSWKPLTYIGIISYSLYLYDFAFYHVTSRLLPGIPPGSLMWYAASILINLAAGIIGYYAAEYPFIKLRARLREKPVPAAEHSAVQVPSVV